jgi:hypothetical protein
VGPRGLDQLSGFGRTLTPSHSRARQRLRAALPSGGAEAIFQRVRDIDLEVWKGEMYYKDLLTETELIDYLRIPEISKATNYHNAVENLKRMHGLPCIHIARQALYPLEAIRQWIYDQITRKQRS